MQFDRPVPQLGKPFKNHGQTNVNEFAAYICLFIDICLLSTVFKEILKEVYEKSILFSIIIFLIVFATVEDFTGGGVCGCLFCVQGGFHVLDNGV